MWEMEQKISIKEKFEDTTVLVLRQWKASGIKKQSKPLETLKVKKKLSQPREYAMLQ